MQQSQPSRSPRWFRLRALAPALGLATLTLVQTSSARADWLADLSNPFEAALESGNWTLALGLIFLAGVATSLTPCVYPMIAITVSVFGARQAKSRLHGAMLSSLYVLGICALFTPLGLAVGLGGGVFGASLGEWYVVFPLAFFLVAMAASMFGAFELNLPPALQNRLAQTGGLGPKGAFVLGMVGGIIAAPCTGPVLGGLLTYIANTRNAAFGAAALFSYALGLGVLTWLVGTFAIGLPKSGRWLESVKSVFGLVMACAGLWFIRDFVPGLDTLVEHTPAWLVGSLVVAALGVALGAVHLDFHIPDMRIRARKGAGIAMAVFGTLGAVLWAGAAPPLPEGARLSWMDDYERARALAQEEGKPLMVDFGASWCGACEELERDTFSDPRIVAEGRRFVMVRIDLSPGEDIAHGRELLATYEHRGLPLVVIHDSDGDEAERITGFVEAEQMLQMMEEVR